MVWILKVISTIQLRGSDGLLASTYLSFGFNMRLSEKEPLQWALISGVLLRIQLTNSQNNCHCHHLYYACGHNGSTVW